MRKLQGVLLAALIGVAGIAGLAHAQGVDDCAIVGTVVDQTGAVVAGASVTVSGPALIGGARRATSGRDGTYRFTGLAAGSYEVAGESPGFRTTRRGGIALLSGLTLTVDLHLDVGGVSDVLEVRGTPPLVDVKSPASPTNLDQDMLEALPTNRWLPDVVNLTPGVAGDVAFGGTQGSNGMYVDGVDITTPNRQDAWGRFNYNWVQEVQVVGLGASAEHGGFTGTSMRSTVRSGSNRFTGLGEYWTSRRHWLSDNTGSLEDKLKKEFAPRQLLSQWDANVQAGGPVLRDRLWFFAGLQRVTDDSRPAGYSGEGSRREQDPRAIVKLSAAPAASVRLEGFLEKGTYRVIGEGINAWTPIEASWDTRHPQIAWSTRLTWALGSRTMLDARGGGMASTSIWDSHAPATRAGPPPRVDMLTWQYSGNAPFVFEEEGSRQSLSAVVTHYAEQYLGRHEFKFGFEYERARSRFETVTPGGVYYMDYGGEPYLAYLGGDSSSRATMPRASAYAQDEWRISSRITVNPGVRISFNRGQVPGAGQIFSTTPISPRLGLAWDVAKDHRTVVRLHYGRYHDPTFGLRITSGDRTDRDDWVVALVTAPGQFVEIDRYPPLNNFAIDPDIRHSYVDQYVVGLERQVTSRVSAQVQYIRRNYDAFMGLVDTGSTWEPVQVPDTGPDAVAGTPDDGGMLTGYRKTNPGNEFYLYTNPDGAFRRYDAVQVIGRRRYADGWQLQTSYTWSRNMGTVTNHWHANAGQYDLGNPGSWVNPNEQVNAYGHAPFDFTHEFKVLGSYRLPFWGGAMVSGVYRVHTGYAWGRYAQARIPGYRMQRIKVEPRGVRRTPAINNLDLRIEKTFPLGTGRTLGIYVDVLNTGNQGVPDAEQSAPIIQNSGLNFGQPTWWVNPRSVRAGVRVTF